MVIQLLLVGYFLAFIFESENAWIVLMVIMVMVLSASWISLRTSQQSSSRLFSRALLSIVFGGGMVLVFISQMVLELSPWYKPSYIIPIAGMIFANAMNSISIAIERLEVELDHKVEFEEARKIAYQTSLIPIINSLFAVGLVSLPGMMTGQILSGVSPLIAVRYQIVVMCMIFGSGGITTAIFLTLVKHCYKDKS
jgi:putative ABC transport system permease protein